MNLDLLSADMAVARAGTADILDRIIRDDVHLAVWRRALPADLHGLASTDWDMIDDIDVVVPVTGLAGTVPGLLDGAGYRDTAALAREIVARGRGFAATVGCTALRIRLDVIETDACRKFHADHVTVRLLLPLVGPGTQWRAANREDDTPEDGLRTGDVGVFKGRIWADPPVILHRSPPIAASGATRLLLAVDPAA